MESYELLILQVFAARVRARRYELKMTQMQLAELMDIHINSVGRIERGQADPCLSTIVKLARALKIHPGELLPW